MQFFETQCIWLTVYWVNLQHNNYSLTRLTYILLLHYLGESSHLPSKDFSNQSKVLHITVVWCTPKKIFIIST